MKSSSIKFPIWWRRSEREREAWVEEVVQKIESYAAERHLYGKIYGRPKHIYSIYRKMQDKKKRFDEIYDLIAIRCILESPSDVYAMLGYIHELWKPMPGRFKDYIANRKANGYQSIHTTVYGPKRSHRVPDPYQGNARGCWVRGCGSLGL